MIRMRQVSRLAKFFDIPESTANDYYFSARLVTLGRSKFDPASAAGRVSGAEYQQLRKKLIEVGGSSLTLGKWLFYLRFIIAFMSIVFCALRTTLRYTHSLTLTMTDCYIMVAAVIVPNFIVNCAWSKFSVKLLKKLQDFLNQENTTTFKEKKVEWKLNSGLVYMHLHIIDDSNYIPPPQLGNTLQAFPIKSKSHRQVHDESVQPEVPRDERFLVPLQERRDQLPNTQNLPPPSQYSLNPASSPPINMQPTLVRNNYGLYSQPSETWDYRS